MTTTPNSIESEQLATPSTQRRLYRSNSQKVLAGVCGGLGEYFSVDPVLGPGSGSLYSSGPVGDPPEPEEEPVDVPEIGVPPTHGSTTFSSGGSTSGSLASGRRRY